jgi:hypothetical protein
MARYCYSMRKKHEVSYLGASGICELTYRWAGNNLLKCAKLSLVVRQFKTSHF